MDARKLYEGEDEVPEDLIDALLSRLSDTSEQNPESPRVKRMCAVAVGRMKSDRAVATLYEMAEYELGTTVALACGWAIEKITGKQEDTPQRKRQLTDWFLAPNVP